MNEYELVHHDEQDKEVSHGKHKTYGAALRAGDKHAKGEVNWDHSLMQHNAGAKGQHNGVSYHIYPNEIKEHEHPYWDKK